jgi:transposase
LRQLRRDGRREPKPHGRGFPSILDEDDGAVLRSLVAAKNDATVAEYTQAFTAITGEEISESSMCRALRRHGLVVKKRLCGRVSNGGRMLPPNGMTSAKKLRQLIQTDWSSWMRVGF